MGKTATAMEALADVLGPVLARRQAQQYGIGAKHDVTVSAGSLRTEYSHGPDGLLTWPGVDQFVFNATMGAESLLSHLPSTPSVNSDPTYAIISGVTAGSGSEKQAPCDNAPVAGLLKSCMLHSVFGRYERSTDQIEINRLGQRTDRADPLDLMLVGSPMAAGTPWAGANQSTPIDILTNEISRLFWERNVEFFRLLARQLWTGTPLNNTGSEGYKELTGLELLVNTGHHDALTGVACPAVDSYVSNFNYTGITANGGNTVAALTDVLHQLTFRARRMNLTPVRFVIVMREQLFYMLTEIWPCSYLSYRCSPSSGVNGNVDAAQAVQFRDEMRSGRYLLVDGIRYDVIFDDGIPEVTNTQNANVTSGCFASDIFVLPMSVVGGRSTLYLEYMQYTNPSIQEALALGVLGNIEGAFITWPRQTNLCVQWQSKIEPRLILRTPYLAGRLDNVEYCPIQHVRDPFPTDPYFVDGGRTSRPGPSYYEQWNG